MIPYTQGEFYTFEVVGIREENDSKYIYLSDGYKETYRVKPYDYQLEWEDYNVPKKLTCFVKETNIYGLPYLVQDRSEVLKFCYSDLDTEYAFKVIKVAVDTNTQANYYDLNDSFGLYHRYYTKSNEPSHQIGDIFSLLVKGISIKEKNKSFLNLEYPQTIIEPIEILAISETSQDPRKDSIFGFESPTKEFKSTIVYPAGTIEPNIDKQLSFILKTIAGFQNAEGGELYVGVDDSGKICGINQDYQHLNTSETDSFKYQTNIDGYENKIRTAVRHGMGGVSNSHIEFNFATESGLDYLIMKINEVQRPVFVNGIKLFQRTGNMTQLLKGDEITYFIEHRLKLRNLAIENIEIIDEEIAEEKSTKNKSIEPQIAEIVYEVPTYSLPEIDEVLKNDTIWYYITLYNSGEWSFQRKPSLELDIMKEIPIYNTLKRGRIVMVYDNGCVNIVNPYELINNKNNPSKTPKKESKRYSNGYNKKAILVDFNCVPQDYFLVFKSRDIKTDLLFRKAHRVSDISIHTTLNLEGNVLINPRLNGELIEVNILPNFVAHLITGFTSNKNQTSTTLGVKEGDKDYRNAFQTLKELINKYSIYWKN